LSSADAFLPALQLAPRADRRRRLTDWLCDELVVFLGFESDEQIEPGETFPDLGFDSLRAVDFKILLEQKLNCSLESTLLFDCPTPTALVEYLVQVLALEGAQSAAAEATDPGAAA